VGFERIWINTNNRNTLKQKVSNRENTTGRKFE
jgi:hypothetical protein